MRNINFFTSRQLVKKEPIYRLWMLITIICGLLSPIIAIAFKKNLSQILSDASCYNFVTGLLLPLIIEFLITDVVLSKKGQKRHFGTLKVKYTLASFLIILVATILYCSPTRDNIFVQIVVFVIGCYTAYLFYLCMHMSEFKDLISKYDDTGYVEQENKRVKKLKESETKTSDEGIKL